MDADKVNETSVSLSNEYGDYLDCANLHLIPERKLFSAVLERAILDLLSLDTKLEAEAEEWFTEPLIEKPELCTFQHICQELDLDPLKMREKVLSHREKTRQY